MSSTLDFQFVSPKGTDVKAGDTVLACNPWLSAVAWDCRSAICAFCWMPSRNLRACTKCHYCHYCNEKCQKAHWEEEHRRECSVLELLIDVLQLKKDPVPASDTFSPTAEFLFFKAMIRFSEKNAVMQKTFQDKNVLDYFREPLASPRWDRIVMPQFCETIVNLHNKFSVFVKKVAPASTIPRVTRQQIAQNVFLTSEYIKTEYFAGGSTAGTGLYLAPSLLPNACRGNCAWLFSGRQYVLKALVDIPDFRSLDQLSVSPAVNGDEFLTRLEKQRATFMLKYIPQIHLPRMASQPGPIDLKEFWPCRCIHCSDEREAELNPIKCITSSCMEPIPCDSRAEQPCPQCGTCNGSQLAMAREEHLEFSKKLITLTSLGGMQKFSSDYDEMTSANLKKAKMDLGKAFRLEKEMDTSGLIHPDCMARNVLSYRISNELYLQERHQEALSYREKSLAFMKNYYGAYSTVDPCYGYVLFTTYRYWMALAAEHSDGRCRKNCRKPCCRNRPRYEKMGLEGKAILVNFQNVAWTDEQVKKLVINFDNTMLAYLKHGLLPDRKP